ncbi:hypothetical protein E2C01_088037 [Portunus trituberculatus]|uniref:Uncharacterized protein n=1 Tax=Portunus trituberculatus TaxID=210409 RepID=A0A5B7JKW9_PORTR|nr:hypothetical protein [Portunus trituberculatus]
MLAILAMIRWRAAGQEGQRVLRDSPPVGALKPEPSGV